MADGSAATKAPLPWRRRKRRRNREAASEIDKPLYPLGRWFYVVLMRLIVLATRFVMKCLNKTYLHDGANHLERLVGQRDADVGLLTVSNHQSMADDPGIWCGTLPIRMLNPVQARSILMDRGWYCALGRLSAAVFRGLKCLPLRRGDPRGLRSPELAELHARLNGRAPYDDTRDWCHIMAEGRVLQPWRFDPCGLPRLGKLRYGAAKLIATSPPTKTVVLPIFHDGLCEVLPETPPKGAITRKGDGSVIVSRRSGTTENWIPRIGKRIDVFVGEPIDFYDLVLEYGLPFDQEVDFALLDAVNDRLRTALLGLEKLAAEERRFHSNTVNGRN